MSTSINPSLKDGYVKPMSSKTDILSLFETSSVEDDELSPPPSSISTSPSETVTTTNLSYSFDTSEAEKRNSPSSIFRENKGPSPLDLLDNPATSFNNAEGFAPTTVKRRSSSSNDETKKQLTSDAGSYKSSASSKSTNQGSKKKVKKRIPDPPDISKFFNEESTKKPPSTLQQRKSRSQKWQPTPTKKVKKTFPDSVDLPAGYHSTLGGNGQSYDIEAVRALVEHAQASIDPSVTLSLERTLYASLQHSWLLAVGGVGLMSVGENLRIPTDLGIALVGISILSVLGALIMHYVRLFQIKSGTTFKFWQTALFTSLFTLCILVTLALELYYGILYPYLRRTWSVQVENMQSDINTDE
ncbi:unnamed protein product [Cylindrotheca closterium]|uniref:Uncharacterized protein n=1 Tax=Cylindrotheca closterium TaxID=2856 RepID=A0AAD2CY95_9STRA|nr:unnamed protein product [Cylindrotheca closterium]